MPVTGYTDRYYQSVVRPRREGLHNSLKQIHAGAEVKYVSAYLENKGTGTTLEMDQADGTVGGDWGGASAVVALFDLEEGSRILQAWWSCQDLEKAVSFVPGRAKIGLGNRDATTLSDQAIVMGGGSGGMNIPHPAADVAHQLVSPSGAIYDEGSDIEVMDPLSGNWGDYMTDGKSTCYLGWSGPVIASVAGQGQFSFGLLYCI